MLGLGLLGTASLLAPKDVGAQSSKTGNVQQFNDNIAYHQDTKKVESEKTGKASDLEDAFKFKGSDKRGIYTYDNARNSEYFQHGRNNFGLDDEELRTFNGKPTAEKLEMIKGALESETINFENDKLDDSIGEGEPDKDAYRAEYFAEFEQFLRNLDGLRGQLEEQLGYESQDFVQ